MTQVVAAVGLAALCSWTVRRMWHSWSLWANPLLPDAGEEWVGCFEGHWTRWLEDFCRNPVHPRGFSRASLSDRLRNFNDRKGGGGGGGGVRSRLVITSFCGIWSSTVGSTVEGLLSKVLKCSLHLALMLLFSLSRVEPSADRSGVVRRAVDFPGGAEEHFLVLCGSVGFDFVSLFLPPLVLHSAKCRLGLPLEVFEVVTLWSGGDVILRLRLKAFFLSSRSSLMRSSFSSNQPWWTFSFGPMVSFADSVTRVLSCSHCWGWGSRQWSVGSQPVVYAPSQTCDCVPAASVLPCQKLAYRISQSCDVSQWCTSTRQTWRGGDQSNTLLPSIALVIQTSRMSLRRQMAWSFRCHCFDLGCIHVLLYWSAWRNSVLVMVRSFSAQKLNNMWPFELSFPVPWGPSTPSQLLPSVPTLAVKSPSRTSLSLWGGGGGGGAGGILHERLSS